MKSVHNEIVLSKKFLFLIILFIYLLCVGVRFVSIINYQANNYIKWNGEFIPVNKDSFYWGTIAQKALYNMHSDNPYVPSLSRGFLPMLGSFLVKVFGMKLETVMFYLAVFMAPLLVVPLVLIGLLYKDIWLGVLSAVLACLSMSFYTRTSIGYFDTDMFSVFFPVMIVWLLLTSIRKNSLVHVLLAAAVISIFPYFHRSGRSVVYALLAAYVIYTLITALKEKSTWQAFVLLIISIIEIREPGFTLWKFFFWLARLGLITSLFFLFKKQELKTAVPVSMSVVLLMTFILVTAPHGVIFDRLAVYLQLRQPDPGGYHFFQISETIREAGEIGYYTLARRILGSVPGFLCALAGYVWFCIKKREFLITLPLLGLGIFAMAAGIRFTIYAAPWSALGLVFGITTLTRLLFSRLKKPAAVKILTVTVTIVIWACFLLPNLLWIINTKLSPVTREYIIQPLAELKEKAEPGSYVITNWGYGGIVWFYSGLQTLHAPSLISKDTYLSSRLFRTTSQASAANLASLAAWGMEEIKGEKQYKTAVETILDRYVTDKQEADDFFSGLEAPDFDLPAGVPDVYLFFYYDMLRILGTTMKYSSINPATGQIQEQGMFFLFKDFTLNGDYIELDKDTRIKTKGGLLLTGDNTFKINTFTTVGYHKDKTIYVDEKVLHPGEKYSLIYNKAFSSFIVLDTPMYNSAIVQMYVLERYDPTLFEPVHLGPRVKIYKVLRR